MNKSAIVLTNTNPMEKMQNALSQKQAMKKELTNSTRKADEGRNKSKIMSSIIKIDGKSTLHGTKQQERKEKLFNNKKLQLIKTFHRTVPFLQVFVQAELECLQDKFYLFVFSKGSLLAKEKEIVDYIGVVLEGMALSSQDKYLVGDVIGARAMLGFEDLHPCSILADCEGLILAVRIEDVLEFDKSLKTRLLSYCLALSSVALTANPGYREAWQELQWSKMEKKLPQEWLTFLGKLPNKEQQLFKTYFPCCKAKRKDIIACESTSPYLLILISGQLVCKGKTISSRTVIPPEVLNIQGFIFGNVSICNIYCLSQQCCFLFIEKTLFERIMSFQSIKMLTLKLFTMFFNEKKPPQLQNKSSDNIDEKGWSIFKKYEYELLPLPKKGENKLSQAIQNPPSQSIHKFQTLFQQQLCSPESKTRTMHSENSAFDRLTTIKTQGPDNETTLLLKIEQLKKQMSAIQQKVNSLQVSNKDLKLQLIVSRSKYTMSQVHKQILKRQRSEDQPLQQMNLESNNNNLTLKQAFQNQHRAQKIQLAVAKFAYRWLQITRERKAARKSA